MINISDFLDPISESSPCGENLRYDYAYDQIQESRREDDKDLSQGIWQTNLKTANWPEVERLCTKLLKTKTKDLQIAAWLTESWAMQYGFGGLNDGISLIKALCDKFWDNIFPMISNDDNGYRLAPFFFLIEKMRDRIVLLPITDDSDSSSITYSLSDWLMARHNLKIKNTSGLSLRDINKIVLSSSIQYFQKLSVDVDNLINNFRDLDYFLTDKCKNDAPSFAEILSCLDDIKRITAKNLSDKQIQVNEENQKLLMQQQALAQRQAEIEQSNEKTSVEKQEVPDEPTIDEAYRALQDIAFFLENKQPQSPASILIKIANAIGTKTFKELLDINMNSGASVMSTISELYKILNNNSSDASTTNKTGTAS